MFIRSPYREPLNLSYLVPVQPDQSSHYGLIRIYVLIST